MTHRIICDACGRQCLDDFYVTVTIDAPRQSYGAPKTGEKHLCLPIDGGSVGCAPYIMRAIEWIGKQNVSTDDTPA